MNEQEPRGQLRDDMIDALLQSAYGTDSATQQQRIASVMDRIGSEQVELASASGSSTPLPQPRDWRRWMSWTVAVSVWIALVVVFQLPGSSGYAMSAVQRSIAAAQEFVARQYRVTVTIRDSSQNAVSIESELYVEGSDRFALKHPALVPGTSFWLGSDGQDSWLVPALGPVRTGDNTGLGRWLSQREQLSTPYLHVETVLARMKRGYRLEEKPETTLTLADGTTVTCQHIVGTLRWKRIEKAPDTIELWAGSQTGIAMRLEATWNEPSGISGHQKISMEFVDSPELPPDWFTAAGHHSGFRRTLRFDSDE